MALRQINMIPPNILARTILLRHLLFWGKGLICIFFLFVIFYLAQSQRFAQQQKAHHSDGNITIQVSGKINKTLLAADKIKAQIQDIALKSGMLAAMANQQFYYDILAILSDSFNDSTWIDHLSIQRGKENKTDISNVSIQGFSLTHNTLGTFLESLSDIHRVRDVVLIFAKKYEQTSLELDLSSTIQFKLICSITGNSSISPSLVKDSIK